MIFDKLTILQTFTPGNRRKAREMVHRWTKAKEDNPRLVDDVIELGGVLAMEPRRFDEFGQEEPEPIDPIRLAVERGRRELALELMAMMTINPFELSQIAERNIGDDFRAADET